MAESRYPNLPKVCVSPLVVPGKGAVPQALVGRTKGDAKVLTFDTSGQQKIKRIWSHPQTVDSLLQLFPDTGDRPDSYYISVPLEAWMAKVSEIVTILKQTAQDLESA